MDALARMVQKRSDMDRMVTPLHPVCWRSPAKHKNVDLFVLDRACHFMHSAQITPGLEQLKYYCVDKFTHTGTSASKNRLKKRLGTLNTSVAEQTFNWFRGYLVVLNEMREPQPGFPLEQVQG